MQGYFLPASIIGILGYWSRGLGVPAVTHYYLLSLPAAFPAIYLGKLVNSKLQRKSFLKALNLYLTAIAAALLVQALLA